MCLQQTDLGRERTDDDDIAQIPASKSFVVSLFGAKDDIKAHYSAQRARVCGATWEAFLQYAGASPEDVWAGIEEADRKLWSVSLGLTQCPGKQEGGRLRARKASSRGGVVVDVGSWYRGLKTIAQEP